MKRRHLEEIQIARTLAILAVLIVHSTSTGVTSIPHESFLYPLYNFLNTAGKLGTPTFFMLSSFVLFYNYYPRETSFDLYKKFYIKRLKYILIPYLVFSAFYFGIKWVVYYDYPSLMFALQKFLHQIAIGKAHAHLYFVFISVQFYIMFPLFMYLFKKYEFLKKNAIWIGLLLQWIWVCLNKYYFGITIKGSISFSYFSFYFLGAYLGIYYDEIREKMANANFRGKVASLIFFGYGAMIIFYTGYMYLTRTEIYGTFKQRLPVLVNQHIAEFSWATYAFFAALVIFYVSHVLLKKVNDKTKKIFIEIGATSFGIYLIHPFFLMILRELLPSGEPIIFHSWQLFTFVVISLLSWAVVRFTYNYIPHSWIIFGSDSNRRKK